MQRWDGNKLIEENWETFAALTGCGNVVRDVLDGSFEIYGEGADNADSSHAILNVSQNNPNSQALVANFAGKVNITNDVSIGGNLTINGTAGLTSAPVLYAMACTDSYLTGTPYTLTHINGVLTAVTVGAPVQFVTCRPWCIRGTLDGTLSKDGSQTINTGAYTVYDDHLETGYELTSGVKISANWDEPTQKYWVIAGPCPTAVA